MVKYEERRKTQEYSVLKLILPASACVTRANLLVIQPVGQAIRQHGKFLTKPTRPK